MKRNILIMGGELCNKGAQAMLFTVVNELRNRYSSEYDIYVFSNEDKKNEPKGKYNFEFVSMSYYEEWALAGLEFRIASKLMMRASNNNLQYLRSILKNAILCIDISGFALSSQWGYKHSAEFLVRFSLLRRAKIKSIIMPQSFGPFEFGSSVKNVIMRKLIKHYLKYCSCIYARENEGYKLLTEYIGLKNVKKSTDLVLQSKGFNLENIYCNLGEREHLEIVNHSIGIVPNFRNTEYGNKDDLMRTYIMAIHYLRSLDKTIYLLHHSNEDRIINENLKKYFLNDDNVVFCGNELECFEFEEVVKNFDFVIASRFHSIVHAYKESTPCIVLGWATKYRELCQLFSQQDYMIDVRHKLDVETIKNKIEILCKRHNQESQKISEGLSIVQKSNCFDFFNGVLK